MSPQLNVDVVLDVDVDLDLDVVLDLVVVAVVFLYETVQAAFTREHG